LPMVSAQGARACALGSPRNTFMGIVVKNRRSKGWMKPWIKLADVSRGVNSQAVDYTRG
jgi:hypothetical protein